MPDETIVYI